MAPPHSERNGAHYDEVTGGWSLIMGRHLHFGLFDGPDELLEVAGERLVLETVAAVGAVDGARVLDVGCGTGGPARLLAERFGCRVVGLTNSAVGAALARARGCEVIVADAERHRHAEPVDVVAMFESSHLIADKRAALANAAAALGAGGALVIADLVVAGAQPFSPRELVVARAAFGEMAMVPEATYRALLDELGFEVAVSDVSARAAPTLAAWRARAEARRAELETIWPPARIRRFVEACRLTAAAFASGKLGYALLCARRRPTA